MRATPQSQAASVLALSARSPHGPSIAAGSLGHVFVPGAQGAEETWLLPANRLGSGTLCHVGAVAPGHASFRYASLRAPRAHTLLRTAGKTYRRNGLFRPNKETGR